MNRKIVLTIVALFLLILYSCRINDCGCDSVSLLNGRWNGVYSVEEFSLEMTISLSETNSNVSGSGVCSIFKGANYKDIPITLVGSFVSNRLTFKLVEIDSINFDGYLDSTGNKIIGNLFYKDTLLPYVLNRISQFLY
jgi:hypothetical protein